MNDNSSSPESRPLGIEEQSSQNEDDTMQSPVHNPVENNGSDRDSGFISENEAMRDSDSDEVQDDLEERINNSHKFDTGQDPSDRFEVLSNLHAESLHRLHNDPEPFARDTANQSSCMIKSYNKANENNVRLEVGINQQDKTLIYQGFKTDSNNEEKLVYTEKFLGLTPNLNIFRKEDIDTHTTILGSKSMVEQDSTDYNYIDSSDTQLTGAQSLHKSAIDSNLPVDDRLKELTEDERFFKGIVPEDNSSRLLDLSHNTGSMVETEQARPDLPTTDVKQPQLDVPTNEDQSTKTDAQTSGSIYGLLDMEVYKEQRGTKRTRVDEDKEPDTQEERSSKRRKSESDSDSNSGPSGPSGFGGTSGPGPGSGPEGTSGGQSNFRSLDLKEVIVYILSSLASISEQFLDFLM